jgi:hypothetical protein
MGVRSAIMDGAVKQRRAKQTSHRSGVSFPGRPVALWLSDCEPPAVHLRPGSSVIRPRTLPSHLLLPPRRPGMRRGTDPGSFSEALSTERASATAAISASVAVVVGERERVVVVRVRACSRPRGVCARHAVPKLGAMAIWLET